MTMMWTIEKNGWEVGQNLNGIIVIRHDNGEWVCDHSSAFEAVADEVADPEARRYLLAELAKRQFGRVSK